MFRKALNVGRKAELPMRSPLLISSDPDSDFDLSQSVNGKNYSSVFVVDESISPSLTCVIEVRNGGNHSSG